MPTLSGVVRPLIVVPRDRHPRRATIAANVAVFFFQHKTRGGTPAPIVFSRDWTRRAVVMPGRLPMMPPAPPIPRSTRVARSDYWRAALVYRVPLLAPPVPGGTPKPIVFRRDYRRGAVLWVGRPVPVINPARIAGGVPAPICLIGPRGHRRGLFYAPSPIPIEPASHLGDLILFRGGPSTSPNIPPPVAREPLYMTDTNQLFVGDGFNRHFIGGDFVSAPAHSTSTGIAGQRAWDGTYLYFCIAANSWVRVQPGAAF